MIILKANAGLCNKLLSIAAGLHLAKDIGCRLHVLWATDWHMDNLFTDLFEPVNMFTLHQLRIPRNRLCRGVANRLLPRLFGEKDGIEAILADEKKFLERCKNGARGVLMFSSFREFVSADDFSWLKPCAEIRNRIAEFRHLTEGQILGMHIRRGDHRQAMRCSPLHLFYEKIAEEVAANPCARFFLCTDDPIVKADLRSKYPLNVFVRDAVLSRREKGGVADAVVDLWLLSQCKKIYGTYPSSFSLVAAKIGRTGFSWIRDEREPL